MQMTSTSWSPATATATANAIPLCNISSSHSLLASASAFRGSPTIGCSFNNSLIPEFSNTKLKRFPAKSYLNDHTNANTPDTSAQLTTPGPPPVQSSIWIWRDYSIRYQSCGDTGPALVLVHGFGANSDHWRKNLPVLGNSHRVYSIDLIGYGYSDKPNPRHFGDTSFYTFETWASQLNDFCLEVVKDEAFFICNSIGGLVGLQAAIMAPKICKGLVLLNISLRMLHIKKQPKLARPLIKSFQSFLR